MEKIKQYVQKFQYKGLLVIVLVFILMAALLLVELRGIQANRSQARLGFLPADRVLTKHEAWQKQEKTTLVLLDSSDITAEDAWEQFAVILTDMKVGYDLVDTTRDSIPSYTAYENVLVLMSDTHTLGQKEIELCDWVYAGGNAMFPLTLQKTPYSSAIASKLGIMSMTDEYSVVDSIFVSEDFMVGGGRGFVIEDGYDSSWLVELFPDEKTTVYMWTNDGRKQPLVWKTQYGKGSFVVDNFGLCEKSMRGFYAASYSLMGDVGVYPVINGSVFYLDDFPSQIPEGDSQYITRDYQTSIRSFYINIWWPTMMNLADQYGLKYTGLAIECYDDAVDGTTDARPDTETFLNFGNMLLRKGGELGYHGYNHQPLCFANCDYQGLLNYKTWETYTAMKTAFDELVRLCHMLFTDTEWAVYVPPSNILSKEGREFLLKEYPSIRTISGIYFRDANLDFACVQEFEVYKNGVVDQPRIVSGCELSDYMEIAAISELNFHFVNNHFTHPDDALDPERGAEMGWAKLTEEMKSYLSWLYGSAPTLRNMTGSELSGAVQRFAAVSYEKEQTEEEFVLHIRDFYDEAQFMLRFNTGEPHEVTGGKLTHLTGDLYLLSATQETVRVLLK